MTADLITALRAARPGYHPGWGAQEYTDWLDEQLSWKRTCYVGDWSFLWDLVVSGPDALKVFRDTSINGFESFQVGQAKHVVQCSPSGKVIGDGVLMRLSEDSFVTQGAPALYTSWVIGKGGYDVHTETPDRFQLQVSGPTALPVCQKVTGSSLTDVKFMRFAEAEIAGVPVWALRQGMAGEIGFEFHGPREGAQTALDAILEAGEEHGIRRLGARTVMINHLEAAFPTGNWHFLKDSFHPALAGMDAWVREHFDTYGLVSALRGSFESDDVNDYLQDPITLGWGKSIRFDHEFVGREALEVISADPPRRRVTLEFDPDDVVDVYVSQFREGDTYDQFEIPHSPRWTFHADAVLHQGRVVGLSTNPGYSRFFGRMLALAYVDTALAEPGTRLKLLWGNPGTPQKEIGVVVAPAPYKTDRRRSDLTTASFPAN